MKIFRVLPIVLIAFILGVRIAAAEEASPPSLWDVHKMLSQKRFVDLTHSFKPGIPKWDGYPDEKTKVLYDYRKSGFRAELYTLPGQWGTHVDAPAHFHPGARTIDQIDVKDMILPMVIIDISEKVKQDPDARLEVDDILVWESRFGKIPAEAFVACQTNWQKRWPDVKRIQNKDPKGVMHTPGWSAAALKLLVEERNILCIGHETMDTDPGVLVSDDRYPAEAYLLGQDRFEVSMLANLDQVPETGSLAVISFPKPEKGTGFSARVFAIVP